MIKKIKKENLEEIIDLIFETTILFNTSNQIKNDIQSKKMFKEFFIESFNDMDLFGYFNQNKIVGVIGIESYNYIPILYVLNNYQKQGIGTKLLQYIKNYVKGKTEKIDVCADYKAVSFYEKNGFNKQESFDDKVMMSCTITNIKQLKFSQIEKVTLFLWNFIKKDFKQNIDLAEVQFKKFIINETLKGLNFYGFFEGTLLKGIIGVKENYIMFLYVLEEYQRQGIGTELLDYAIQGLDYDDIYLDADETSLLFYEKYGFVIDEENEKKHSIAMKLRRKKYEK